MEKIEFITCDSGDWEVLRIDGEVYDEGHSICLDTWLSLLARFGTAMVTEDCISDEDMEYGRY